MEVVAEKREVRYSFEEVRKTLYKIAINFCERYPRYQFDELVNEVWLKGRIQKAEKIHYVKRIAYFDMLYYIIKMEGRDIKIDGKFCPRPKHITNAHNRENGQDIYVDSDFFTNQEDMGRSHIDKVDDKDEVEFVLSHIPKMHRDILLKYYLEEMSLIDIGKAYGRKRNSMSVRRKRALELIRKEEIIITDKRLTEKQSQKKLFDGTERCGNRQRSSKRDVNILPEYVSDFEIDNKSALEEEFILERDWEE